MKSQGRIWKMFLQQGDYLFSFKINSPILFNQIAQQFIYRICLLLFTHNKLMIKVARQQIFRDLKTNRIWQNTKVKLYWDKNKNFSLLLFYFLYLSLSAYSYFVIEQDQFISSSQQKQKLWAQARNFPTNNEKTALCALLALNTQNALFLRFSLTFFRVKAKLFVLSFFLLLISFAFPTPKKSDDEREFLTPKNSFPLKWSRFSFSHKVIILSKQVYAFISIRFFVAQRKKTFFSHFSFFFFPLFVFMSSRNYFLARWRL